MPDTIAASDDLQVLLEGYRFNLAQKLARSVARRWQFLRYRVLDRRYGRLVLEEIEGVPLIVFPEVFNPVLLRSGQFMAQTLLEYPPDPLHALSVLDLGTGSGVGAIFAAKRGARVTAVDINPEAVRCARLNALLNGLNDRIEVLAGDLFEPVGGKRFDLILFNPPYFKGKPRDNLDRAWRSPDVFERFVTGLGQVLQQQGQALVVLSTDGNCAALLRLLDRADFAIEEVARRNLVNEIEFIYSVKVR